MSPSSLLSLSVLLLCSLNVVKCHKLMFQPGKHEYEALQEDKGETVPCPDGGSCTDGQTCCELASGAYGCCPHPNAVCCYDKTSCCPNGFTCDVQDQKCLRASTNETKPMLKKRLATVSEPKQQQYRDHDVPCPGGGSCADGQTCCLLASGQYGCCPYPNAVCCSDKASCCPEGYKCDVPDQKCVQASTNDTKPMLKKRLATVSEPKEQNDRDHDVPCPGGGSCADGQTCCLLASGQYGCCPYPNAVCCSDQATCCPNGYTCDVPNHQCIAAIDSVKLVALKVPVTLSEDLDRPSSDSLLCPDSTTCAGTSSCCRTYTNTYSCCVYPNDVCCDDGLHCCPRLTICDQRTLTCLPGSKSAPWERPGYSVPATPKPNKVDSSETASTLVCPSGTSCAGTAACCRTYSGTYNCCNYPNDVCCSDGLHCCARGSICDLRTLMCIPGKDGGSLTWYPPKPAVPSV